MDIRQIVNKRNVLGTLSWLLLYVLGYIVLKTWIISPAPNEVSYTNNNFYVFDLDIPNNLEFCGEKIPSNDFGIKRDLEKEFFNSAYWKNNSLALFQKAQRWFPYIEPILKQQRIPDDFKYLCVIESHLSNASSSAGAAGFWQLVPGSARNYGLEVNERVDERYDVEKATRAACAHIRDAYKVFRNWTLAAAAYNRGIGGIQNAMARQKTSNYYELLLNRETGSFVYRILAYKTLLANPGHFGIKKKRLTYYPRIPYKSFRVDSSIHNLPAFARHIGTTAGTIRLFNPWLLKNELHNPEGKVYEIRIPKNQKADYTPYLKDLLVKAGDLARYTEDPVATLKKIDADTSHHLKKTYVVKGHESLKHLAEILKVSEEDLRRWNHLDEKEEAVPGQTLIIHYRKP